MCYLFIVYLDVHICSFCIAQCFELQGRDYKDFQRYSHMCDGGGGGGSCVTKS